MKDFDYEREKVRLTLQVRSHPFRFTSFLVLVQLMYASLQNTPGRMSFSLDCWTSPNCIAFLGITAHYIDEEWNLKNKLIDFVDLSGPHSGENLCAAFINSLDGLGILSKVFNLLYII